MMHESKAMPQFFPTSFKDTVDDFLQTSLGIRQNDVTTNNIERIYKYIIDNIEIE